VLRQEQNQYNTVDGEPRREDGGLQTGDGGGTKDERRRTEEGGRKTLRCAPPSVTSQGGLRTVDGGRMTKDEERLVRPGLVGRVELPHPAFLRLDGLAHRMKLCGQDFSARVEASQLIGIAHEFAPFNHVLTGNSFEQ